MKNYFKNFVEANFQVRDGEHDSTFPDTFSLGNYKQLLRLPRSDKRTLPAHPGVYPQNFIYHRTPYLDVIICNGV